MFKRVIPFLFLAVPMFAADAPPQLSDAQKYQAMRLYSQSVQIQEATKNLQESSKNLQTAFQELSSTACGKSAMLSFALDSQGVMTPSCKANEASAEPPKK